MNPELLYEIMVIRGTPRVGGGSANEVVMDYSAGTLTIRDSSGLTGVGPLAAFVAGNTLTMNAGNLILLNITDVVLDTGDGEDDIRIKGTPDVSVVTTFTGQTSVQAGADAPMGEYIEMGRCLIEKYASSHSTATIIDFKKNSR